MTRSALAPQPIGQGSRLLKNAHATSANSMSRFWMPAARLGGSSTV
jgi:hypothetical protein